jgi:hypothetical protein
MSTHGGRPLSALVVEAEPDYAVSVKAITHAGAMAAAH